MTGGAAREVFAVLLLAAAGAHAEMTFFAYDGKIRTVGELGAGKDLGSGTVTEISSLGDRKFGGSWNIEFCGIMNVKTAGAHTFTVTSDDGSALFIDGREVVINDGLHGSETEEATVQLEAGARQINLLYFNNNGGHQLKASVKTPAGTVRRAGGLVTAGSASSCRGP